MNSRPFSLLLRQLPVFSRVCNGVLALALLFGSAQVSFAGPPASITATKDDGIPAATTKNPGDQVTYTIQINNTGGSDATGVQLIDPPAANTTDVAGTLDVTPVALNDTYPQTVFANMSVNTATSGFSVVTNDFAGYSGGNPVAQSALTITTFSASSANGGAVTMITSGANVGQFTYAPAPGFTGADTFTYTISNGVAGTPAGSATATVSLTVSGPVIWFVDSTAPGGGNGTWTGTNSQAFQTVAQAAAVDAANHRIFVLNNSGSSINYANGVALNTTEWLIGQGATGASFDAFMGISPGTDTPARPAISGVRPNLQGTVTLETNAKVQGLNLATTTATGLNDPAGAITGVTVNEVSVTTTTGTAVLLSSTGGTFTFDSISANGATKGISVTTTTGSFTVNGTGATAGSGGTIQNCPTRGAEFISSSNVTLKNMNFTGNGTTAPNSPSLSCGDALASTTGNQNAAATCQSNIHLNIVSNVTLDNVTANNSKQNGINANDVTGLTLTNVTAQGNGDEVGEDGVQLVNAKGTITVSGGTFKDNAANQFEAQNATSTAATFNLSTSFFGLTNFPTTGAAEPPSPGAATLADALQIAASGSANMTVSVTGSTFEENFAAGYASSYANTATMNITVGTAPSGNTFTNNGIGLRVAGNSTGAMTYTVRNNTITNDTTVTGTFTTSAMAFSRSGAGAVWNGTVDDNVIGVNGGAAYSGCFASGCNGMEITDSAAVSANPYHATITNNEIYHVQGGITSNIGGVPDGAPTTSLVIQGNTIGNPDPPFGMGGTALGNAIQVNAGTLSTNVPATCVEISGNTLNGAWGDPANHDSLRLRSRGAAGSTFRVRNWNGVGGDAAAMTFLESINTINNPIGYDKSGFQVVVVSFTGGAGACPLLFAPRSVSPTEQLFALLPSFEASQFSPVRVLVPVGNIEARMVAPASNRSLGNSASVVASTGKTNQSISQAELDSIVAAAKGRWIAIGLVPQQIATLESLSFEVADLANLRLGEADGNQIRVDSNAGGNGWFIDASAGSDALFAKESSAGSYIDPASAPAGRIDLLTAIMHEMGHALGLNDSYLEQDQDSLMYGYLTKGERRLPVKNQARGAIPHAGGEMHFLAAPVTIGTLPAGKSVVVTYTIMINPSIVVPFISNQGTVHSTTASFADVPTDDPTLPGSADPTVTLVLIAPTPSPTPTATPTATATATATATVVPLLSISGKVTYCADSNPVPGVTMTLTGPSPAPSSTPTDALGNYTLGNLTNGGTYTVAPSKADLPPSTSGINTADVIAAQKHYLTVAILPPGCGRDSGDVNGDGAINTFDVIAIQRFFVGQTFGTANVGKYRFMPMSRSYPNIATDQTGQDYVALVLGDIVAGYVHRPEGGPSQDAAGDSTGAELPATVGAVSLPNGAVDASVTNFIAQVTTTAIDAANKLVGFQGDFTFDERVISFQSEPVQGAGLTAGKWNLLGNVLPGTGPIRTLRISGYSTDLTPLSGEGTLFELRMIRVSKAALGTQLIWAAGPDGFIFIDVDLKTQKAGYTGSGGVKSSGEAPAPVKPAPARTIAPLDMIDPDEADEAALAGGNSEIFRERGGVLFALFQRTTPREPWQRIRLE